EVRLIDLFERHRNEASLKGCKYTISCPKNLSIRGRPNALARMVGNLVTNAFRHAGKVKVTAIDDGQDAVLWIDDNGSGIPAKDREEVFKPFLRLDEARNQDESGTGLGLPIARDIARLHGGDIKLEDSPMGGLRATIRLPH
ncbi:MAG: HAMP domain-containing histidine kinase, partial [Nitratireductor sp.]|nr:HAMP domain-containing histidine kinase [Nitratireductor sp.]